MQYKIMILTVTALTSALALLSAPSAWSAPSDEDRLYIQQYCEQTYGNAYYEQEDERTRAISECVAEQSQYYSQDTTPNTPPE